jgi:alkanesulfonate monooxygenase SsuD/methylene tetrahydromethanopterin reductase-like flavin-dependent oxidoreductase (luciferase family)
MTAGHLHVSECEGRVSGDSTWTTHPWVEEGVRRVRFGVDGGGAHGDWSALLDWAQMVEDLGFDSFWINDHTTLSWRDCWTALAAVAVKTHRIRLGSLVSCVFYRPPALLARMAADVDRLSGGRLVLGLGVGDAPFEFAELGLEYPRLPERQSVLAETVEIVRGLWSEAPFTFEGKHFHLNEAKMTPGPLQQPRVPILIAGGGERVTLGQVARYADASNFGASAVTGSAWSLDDVCRKYEALRAHCAASNRPYESVLRTFAASLVLAETPDEVSRKLDASSGAMPRDEAPRVSGMPREVRTFYNIPGPERIPLLKVAGTPEEAVPYLQALIDAGVQYVIVPGGDAETVRLMAEQVVPKLLAA